MIDGVIRRLHMGFGEPLWAIFSLRDKSPVAVRPPAVPGRRLQRQRPHRGKGA